MLNIGGNANLDYLMISTMTLLLLKHLKNMGWIVQLPNWQ